MSAGERIESPVEAALFVASRRSAILAAAEDALAAHSARYAGEGPEVVERRLDLLFERLVETLAERDLGPLLRHAHDVAEERFLGGYGLGEVQSAYNALEEAIWARVLAEGVLERYGTVLPSVSAALGAAKDELARAYVRLATGAQAPAVDVAALARGVERG